MKNAIQDTDMKQDIKTYTAQELKEKIALGESQSDFAAVAAKSEEQLDQDIQDDPDSDVKAIDLIGIGDKPAAFIPQTEADINWVVMKINEARARADRIYVQAEVMAKQAEAEAKYFEWKYGSHLQAYARRELQGKSSKSIALFHGTIGFRLSGAKVTVKDKDAALFWAKENLPEAVYEAVDPSMVAKAIRDSGEVVNFAEHIPAVDLFFIK